MRRKKKILSRRWFKSFHDGISLRCYFFLSVPLINQVAQEDQKTFTDLVRQLVSRCGSDIEKARTIFRWITVKNLNTMQFDENLRGDTPMGLLRGIKHGTESYHVLFKRLCR